MIEVNDLTKRYGATLALDHVTFRIEPGQIVGLLGPNGAGKTTMLKLLTGYLPPTEGIARVADLDVAEHSLLVRERIGYLPETNPLYDELSVYESLQWTARLRGKPDDPATLRRVIDQCGLGSVVSKDIGELSKGFRQRVGIAQAILHDPDILILDEPTSGLDPNQQLEVRQLIQTLKQKKTVILSTHILSEAQSSCDRVLIIHRGQIVADGSPDVLGKSSTGARLSVELKAPAAAAEENLKSIPGVLRVSRQRSGGASTLFDVECGADADVREPIFQLAVEKHWPILQLHMERASLEDVFRQLTTPVAAALPENPA
jgi:ABC-2 type transport system ATP-binding protein